jgi:uncharacterized membrane protein YoaK (UPF0700 family)
MILLSIVAGFVDACTYLALFGLFVAQVTGSFVIIGTGLVTRLESTVPLLAVPVFFAGGMLATAAAIIGQAMGRSPLAAALLLETAFLGGHGAQRLWGAVFQCRVTHSARGGNVRSDGHGCAKRFGAAADQGSGFY